MVCDNSLEDKKSCKVSLVDGSLKTIEGDLIEKSVNPAVPASEVRSNIS